MEIQAASGEWMNEFVRRPSRRRDNRVYVPAADIIKRTIRRSWTISNPTPRWWAVRGSPEFRPYSSLPRDQDASEYPTLANLRNKQRSASHAMSHQDPSPTFGRKRSPTRRTQSEDIYSERGASPNLSECSNERPVRVNPLMRYADSRRTSPKRRLKSDDSSGEGSIKEDGTEYDKGFLTPEPIRKQHSGGSIEKRVSFENCVTDKCNLLSPSPVLTDRSMLRSRSLNEGRRRDRRVPPPGSKSLGDENQSDHSEEVNSAKEESGPLELCDIEPLSGTVFRKVTVRRRRQENMKKMAAIDGESCCEVLLPCRDDYKLVFLSGSDDDSSSTASGGGCCFPAADECDWDYFEPAPAGGVRLLRDGCWASPPWGSPRGKRRGALDSPVGSPLVYRRRLRESDGTATDTEDSTRLDFEAGSSPASSDGLLHPTTVPPSSKQPHEDSPKPPCRTCGQAASKQVCCTCRTCGQATATPQYIPIPVPVPIPFPVPAKLYDARIRSLPRAVWPYLNAVLAGSTAARHVEAVPMIDEATIATDEPGYDFTDFLRCGDKHAMPVVARYDLGTTENVEESKKPEKEQDNALKDLRYDLKALQDVSGYFRTEKKEASTLERQYHDQNKPSLREKAKSLKYREKEQSTVPESSTDLQKYDDSKAVPVPKKVCHKLRDRYESTSDSNDQTETVLRRENQSGYYLEVTRYEQQKDSSITEKQYHDQNKPSLRDKAKSLKYREKEQGTVPESSTDHQKYDDAKVVPKKVCHKVRDRYESTSDSNDQTENVPRRENQSGYYLEAIRHEQQKEASAPQRQYHDQNKPSLREKAKTLKYREKEQSTVPESSTDHQKYDDSKVVPVPKKVCHKVRDRYESTSDSNDQTETVLRRENQSGYYLEVTRHEQQTAASIPERQYHDQNKPLLREKAKSLKYREKEQSTVPESSIDHQKYDDTKLVPKKMCHKVRDRYESTSDSNDQTEHVPRRENQSGYYFEMTKHEQQKETSTAERQYHDQNKQSLREKAKSLKYREKEQGTVPESSTDHQKYDETKIVPKKVSHKGRDRYESTSDSNDQIENVLRRENQSGYYLESTRHEQQKAASIPEKQYHDQNKPLLREKAKSLKYREKEQSAEPESSTDHKKVDDTKVVPKKVCHKGRDRYESTSDSNEQTETVPRRENQSGYYLEATRHPVPETPGPSTAVPQRVTGHLQSEERRYRTSSDSSELVAPTRYDSEPSEGEEVPETRSDEVTGYLLCEQRQYRASSSKSSAPGTLEGRSRYDSEPSEGQEVSGYLQCEERRYHSSSDSSSESASGSDEDRERQVRVRRVYTVNGDGGNEGRQSDDALPDSSNISSEGEMDAGDNRRLSHSSIREYDDDMSSSGSADTDSDDTGTVADQKPKRFSRVFVVNKNQSSTSATSTSSSSDSDSSDNNTDTELDCTVVLNYVKQIDESSGDVIPEDTEQLSFEASEQKEETLPLKQESYRSKKRRSRDRRNFNETRRNSSPLSLKQLNLMKSDSPVNMSSKSVSLDSIANTGKTSLRRAVSLKDLLGEKRVKVETLSYNNEDIGKQTEESQEDQATQNTTQTSEARDVESPNHQMEGIVTLADSIASNILKDGIFGTVESKNNMHTNDDIVTHEVVDDTTKAEDSAKGNQISKNARKRRKRRSLKTEESNNAANLAPETNIDNKNKQEDSKQVAEDIVQSKDIVVNDPNETVIAEAMIKEGNDQQMTDSMTSTITENVDTKIATNTKKRKKRRNSKPKDLKVTGDEQIISEAVTEVGRDTKEINVELDDLRNEKTSEVNIESENVNVEVKDTVEESDAKTKDDEIVGDNVAASAEACSKVERCETTTDTAIVKVKSEKKKRQRRKRKSGDMENIESKSNVDKDIDMTVALSKNDQVDDIALEVKTLVVDASLRTVSGEHEYFDSIEDSIIRAEGSNKDKSLKDLDLHTNIKEITDDDEDVTLSATEDDSKSHLATHTNKTNANSTKTEILRNETIANGEVADGAELLEMVPKEPSMTCKDAEGTTRPLTTEIHKENVPTKESQGRTGGTGTVEVPKGIQLVVPKQESTDSSTESIKRHSNKENTALESTGDVSGSKYTTSVPAVPQNERADGSTTAMKEQLHIESTNASEDSVGLVPQCEENAALERTGEAGVEAVLDYNEGSTASMEKESELKRRIDDANCSEEAAGVVPQYKGIDSSTERIRSKDTALGNPDDAGGSKVVVSQHDGGSTASMKKESDEKNEFKRSSDGINCPEASIAVVPQHDTTEGGTTSAKKETNEKNEFKRSTDGANSAEASIGVVPQHDTAEGGTTYTKKETNEKNEFKRSADGANCPKASIGVVPQHDSTEGGTTDAKKETNKKYEFKRSTDGANCSEASLGVVPQHDSTEGSTTSTKKDTNEKNECKRSTDGTNCSEASTGVVPQHESTDGSTEENNEEENASIKSRPAVANYTEPIEACAAPREAVPPEVPLTTEYDSSSPNLSDASAESLHSSDGDGEGVGGGDLVGGVASVVCRPGAQRYTSLVMITQQFATAADRAPAPAVSVLATGATTVVAGSGAGEGEVVVVRHTNAGGCSACGDSAGDVDRSGAMRCWEGQDDAMRHRGTDAHHQVENVTVITGSETLSAFEEGLADDDSWVENLSHDDEDTPTEDSSSGEEVTLTCSAAIDQEDELRGYHRSAIDFTLHTILEDSCEGEESEVEQTASRRRKDRPASATDLEKYFFFGLGDGIATSLNSNRDDAMSETSSIYSEGVESLGGMEDTQQSHEADPADLASSRLEKYFLSGFMGFTAERRDSDGSVGSDSEGRPSPEQRRKRLVRARGTGRSHSSSLDNLDNAGNEQTAEPQINSEDSSSSDSDAYDEVTITNFEKSDGQFDTIKRKKGKKHKNAASPADESKNLETTQEVNEDENDLDDEDPRNKTPQPEPMPSNLTTNKNQQSRDSGFIGSCDDLLKDQRDNCTPDLPTKTELKIELENIAEERIKTDERVPSLSTPPATSLTRKDSFNNWSSDEETNLMMCKMRQFFKTMVANSQCAPNSKPTTPNLTSRTSPKPLGKGRCKPPQLVYFENELTRLMKTVPGIKDEQVREIVEYLSSEDTWSDSYDSSDYTSSDLEGASTKSALQQQISDSCKQIINKFDNRIDDEGDEGDGGIIDESHGLNKETAFVYQKLMASFEKMATGDSQTVNVAKLPAHGSPPLIAKVMHHIGSRLVALMHEVSSGESHASNSPKTKHYHKRLQHKISSASSTTTEDDLPELVSQTESRPDAFEDTYNLLPRSRSHDLLDHTHQSGAADASEEREASDCERFSWRGSFESALLATDSRNKLSLLGSEGSASASALAIAAKRRSAGDLLFSHKSLSREQLDRVRSCGSIGGANSEDKLWTRPNRRRSSVPDATSCGSGGSADGEDEDEDMDSRSTLPRSLQSVAAQSTNSLPRLPTNASAAMQKSQSMYQFLPQNVKSARYRPPGLNRITSIPKRAVSAPGLQPTHQRRGRRSQQVASDDVSLNDPPRSPCATPIGSSKSATPSPVATAANREWHTDDDIDRLLGIHTRTSLSSLGVRSESLASVYSGAGGEGRYGAVTVRGQVEFGLQYNYKASALEIQVRQCRDLAPVDTKRNRSDPYVKVYLLPDKSKSGKRKTKVKKHTLNPIFHECLKFHISLNELETRTLWLTVWHSDMFGRNDFLGEVMMTLENKVFDDPTPRWYQLQERTEPFEDVQSYKGDIIVCLKFVPPDMTSHKKKRSRGALHVLVKEAKSLTGVKANGTSDPFCKSYLLPDKGRSSKQKTPMARRTVNPVWNHTFVYDDVTLQELAERCLELTVWDHDRLGSNEFLGGVRFSLGTGKHYGKCVDWMDASGKELSLWKSMLERPNFWVEGCLQLRASLDSRVS